MLSSCFLITKVVEVVDYIPRVREFHPQEDASGHFDSVRVRFES